jgi:hypothetical protein
MTAFVPAARGSGILALAGAIVVIAGILLGKPGRASARKVVWDLPIVYLQSTSTRGMWNLALVISLSAGLLSAVLTPCLLQLVVVYLAAMAGIGVGNEDERALAFAAFVIGFTVL